VTDLLLVVHAAATWAMVGLSWTVRGVHYPLFAHAAADFGAFHRGHVTRITAVLAIPWAVEGLTALALPFALTGVDRVLALVGLALVVVLAGLTWFGAVPAHQRLAEGFDPDVHRRLLAVDGLRVGLWTVRGLLAAALLV
jgi:hypothetical protein